MLRQLAVMLQKVHAMGLTHSDIKVDNICVDLTREMVRVTLIDLGCADYPGVQFDFDPVQCYHIAPEVATTGTSLWTDIFAVGVLVQAFGWLPR